MASASLSRKEVAGDDRAKASTTSPSAVLGPSVNRRLREALSPSRSPSPTRTPVSDTYGSSTRPDNNSRRPRSPRGEKRVRNDEMPHRGHRHEDSRRHGAHQESRGAYDGRRVTRYDDLDHDRPTRYDQDERDRYPDKRRRTASRSPPHRREYAEGQKRPGHERDGSHDNSRAQGREHNSHGAKRFRESSAGQDSHAQAQSQASKSETGVRFALPSQSSKPSDSIVRPEKPANGTLNDGLNGHADDAVIEQPPAANEALSIEERRKRREAIKAKYKGQGTPLLVQALESASTPSTPNALLDSPSAPSDRSASPIATPPWTPSHDTAPGSPDSIHVSSDAELANRPSSAQGSHTDQEQSAADYDPANDMQDDRWRQDKRFQVDDKSGNGNDETTEDHNKSKQEPSSTSKDDAGDDMFASGDEDDMFAPVSAKKPSRSDGEAPKAQQAKQLDASMLDNWDDHLGYYKIILGELLDDRYQIQSHLGKGVFSAVVRALDSKTHQPKAIKIIRNNESMIKAGAKEIEILETLAEADPDDKKHLIRLERSFTHKGHLCMVFENLSLNLREVLKKFGRDIGINLKAVRSYAQQMFLGLSLLRKCNILHADLKPDNILVNEARTMLKICDLGSAAEKTEGEVGAYLASRFYRAPEVILGFPYDFSIDMWSIGCTLFELYTGRILFAGNTNNQMLRCIMETRGPFSFKMLKKAEYGAVHFNDDLAFRSFEHDPVQKKDRVKLLRIVKPARDLKTRLVAAAPKGMTDAERKELMLFADLLDRCLALNPERRITPAEALKHPFIHRTTGALGVGAPREQPLR